MGGYTSPVPLHQRNHPVCPQRDLCSIHQLTYCRAPIHSKFSSAFSWKLSPPSKTVPLLPPSSPIQCLKTALVFTYRELFELQKFLHFRTLCFSERFLLRHYIFQTRLGAPELKHLMLQLKEIKSFGQYLSRYPRGNDKASRDKSSTMGTFEFPGRELATQALVGKSPEKTSR